MLTKIKIALAAALLLGTASETMAGHVVRCSLVGINTTRHGYIFGKRHPEVAREYGFLKLSEGPGKYGTWGVDPSMCGTH